MAEGIRFPDDMIGKSSPFVDDDKGLMSDSEDAKKAKWWSILALRTFFATLFAKIDGSNIETPNLELWQETLDIALLKGEIGDITSGNAYDVSENGTFATSAGTSNLPSTNKVGTLDVIISGSAKYLKYSTWNNDIMEVWSVFYDGSTWETWTLINSKITKLYQQGTTKEGDGNLTEWYDSDDLQVATITDEGKLGLRVDTIYCNLDVGGSLSTPPTSGVDNNGIFRIGHKTTTWAGTELTMGVSGDSPTLYPAWLQASNPADHSVHRTIVLNPLGGNVAIGKYTASEKIDVNGNVIADSFIIR